MRRILLIGDRIVDQYIFGSCNKISPEAPVVVIEEQRREMKNGGAGNVRENLKALGANVAFYDGDKSPSVKTRVVSSNQQIVRIDKDNPQEVPLPSDIGSRVKEADLVMLCDYNQGVVNKENVEKINSAAKEHGKKIIVDPYRNKVDYGKVDLIKPNKKELESVTGIKVSNRESLRKAGKEYLRMSQAQNLVVTLGAEGMALFDYVTYKDEPFVCTPTQVREVIDVTGAGDTAFAVLGLVWSYEHFSKSTAVRYAIKAAGIAVSRFGCAVVKKEEVFEVNNSFH